MNSTLRMSIFILINRYSKHLICLVGVLSHILLKQLKILFRYYVFLGLCIRHRFCSRHKILSDKSEIKDLVCFCAKSAENHYEKYRIFRQV